MGVMRDLKGAFPGEGELVWRAEAEQRLQAEAEQRLQAEGLTLEALIKSLPIATEAMKIVPCVTQLP